MEKKAKVKVPFILENIDKCVCAECSVQINSKCSIEKREKVEAEKVVPKPKDIPKLYCSSGVTTCKDLDDNQTCICSSCPVWNKFTLAKSKRTGYYCLDGEAK